MARFKPEFQLNREYSSFADPQWAADLKELTETISSISQRAQQLDQDDKAISANNIVQLLKDEERAIRLSRNMVTYSNLLVTIDGTNQEAKDHHSRAVDFQSKLLEAAKPFHLFLARMSDGFYCKLEEHQEAQPYLFAIRLRREQGDTLLSKSEETLIEAMKRSGFLPWIDLYREVSGALKFQMKFEEETKILSVAAAAPYICSRDEKTRKQAYFAINDSWRAQGPILAKALSSLAGWRLEEFNKRSHTREMDYLEVPLRISRIRRETLDAMISAVEARSHIAKKIVQLKNRALGFGDTVHGWNLSAPPLIQDSSDTKVTFDQAIEILQRALKPYHPYFAEFVQRMAENGQIDARMGDNRRPGAFCTSFAKSRRPHVFMSFSGEFHDIRTLAHELGHAFHNDALSSLTFAESSYPMTLAETASIFTETLVGDHLIEHEANQQLVLNSMWTEVSVASTMLIGIPWRYHFEHRLYQERKNGALSAQQLEGLSQETYRQTFGNLVVEVPESSWMKTLHYYIDGRYFYNFPYTFGYLFSLAILNQRETWGDHFYDQYVALLQDTGRMKVEDLADKYFKADLSRETFWHQALDIVERKTGQFESKLLELGLI